MLAAYHVPAAFCYFCDCPWLALIPRSIMSRFLPLTLNFYLTSRSFHHKTESSLESAFTQRIERPSSFICYVPSRFTEQACDVWKRISAAKLDALRRKKGHFDDRRPDRFGLENPV
jgi:hypothetical protein